MSGYFLSMARLALGIGPRAEPLLPTFGEDEGWIEVEPTEREPSPPPTEKGTAPGIHMLETPHRDPRAEFDPETPETVRETVRERRRTDRETRTERIERERKESERHTREERTKETREVRETLTQLLREARTEHLRVLRETSTTHSETQSEREVRTERERILRTQIESRMDTVERLLTSPSTAADRQIPIREEVACDIHIGRIEVRMGDPSLPQSPEEKEPVKGALSLDEYLKLRSRGEA